MCEGGDGKFAILATNREMYRVSKTNSYEETKGKRQIVGIHSHLSGDTKGASDKDMRSIEASDSKIKMQFNSLNILAYEISTMVIYCFIDS